MQRLQPPVAQQHPDEPGEDVPRSRDPRRLPELIAAARAQTDDDERQGASLQINLLLQAMREKGNESAEAKEVLQVLELGALEGLVDAWGRSCRAEAVETLLACGFPHALEVNPEDVEHRERELRERARRLGPFGFFAIAVTGFLALAAAHQWLGDAVVFGALFVTFIVGMSWWVIASRRPGPPKAR